MRTPEEALAAARERAAQAGAGREPDPGTVESVTARIVSIHELAGWALIEPDEADIYSTRRLGAPITALKRLLIRLLRQYLVEVTAQQSRFNAHLLAHLIDLEARVSSLEQVARDAGPSRPADERRPR